MKALSIFEIPDSFRGDFQKNLFSAHIDYKRFSFSDKSFFFDFLERYFPGFSFLDSDNSDSKFFREGLLTRVPSPRGQSFIYSVVIEGIGQVTLLYFELYRSGLKNSVGRIDFKGAYFHFRSFLPDSLVRIYDALETLYLSDSCVSCTRVDTAFDFSVSYPQSGVSWFHPSRGSSRQVRTWFDYSSGEPLLNSLSYLSEKNSGYGVRMYDKIIDIKSKKKQFWYDSSLPPALTRVEYEFYPPYSQKFSSDQILSLVSQKLFGKDVVLGFEYRPQFGFKVEDAYAYISRYAKNHGITVDEFLKELTKYHLTLQQESINS